MSARREHPASARQSAAGSADDRFDALAAALDRDMALLKNLPTVTPSVDATARIRSSIGAEAQRLRARQTWVVHIARISGVAAALLLAATTMFWRPERVRPQDGGYDAALEDWSLALSRSNDAVMRVWLDDGLGSGVDDTIDDFDRAVSKLDELGI